MRFPNCRLISIRIDVIPQEDAVINGKPNSINFLENTHKALAFEICPDEMRDSEKTYD